MDPFSELFFQILATYSVPGEAQLTLELRQRNPKAFAALYDGYSTIVYRFVVRIVNNSSVAEDIVQETFQRLWMRVGQIREESKSVGPWILTIARNLALDYVRSPYSQRTSRNLGIEAAEVCAVESEAFDLVQSEQNYRAIRAAFQSLNDRERQVIELAFYEGCSQSQIAENLQVPLGTVKTWMRRALITLRASIRKQGVE